MSGAGGPAINWDAMPDTKLGSASNMTAIDANTKLFNPNLKVDDPNYGWVTPTQNVNNAQWSDMLGPLVGIAVGAGFGALGAPEWASMLTKAAQFAGNIGGGPASTGNEAAAILAEQGGQGTPQVTGVPAGMEGLVPILLLLNQAFGNKNQTAATTTSGGTANLPVVNKGLFTSNPTPGNAGVQ
jgi:hypothetical protein